MSENPAHRPDDEINDLRQELENFEKEKERVRMILGKVGGVPKTETTIANILFISLIGLGMLISFLKPDWRLVVIEYTTVLLSVKIIYMMHTQMRVNHFKFWILSAIEWRINEMMAIVRRLDRETKPGGDKNPQP